MSDADTQINNEGSAIHESTILCPFCKEKIKSGALKCKHCQSDLTKKTSKNEPEKETKKQETDYNKIGVVLGVVGLIVLPLVFGILAIIFGAIAKGKGSEKNSAIILGIVDIIWWIISLVIGFKLF